MNIRPHEWDRLPWWEQQIYREGLMSESPWIGRVAMLDKAADPLDTRQGIFSNPFEDTDEGTADDLGGFGIQVKQSEKYTPVYRSVSAD